MKSLARFCGAGLLAVALSAPAYSSGVPESIVADFEAEAHQDLSYVDALKPQMKNCTAPAEADRYEWPFKLLSIGHSIASYQKYSGRARFHHGIDIRGRKNLDVFNPFRGQVVMIRNYGSGALYWEVALLDPTGCLWQYHHVAEPSIPKEIRDAYNEYKKDKTKGFVEKGAKVGQIVPWTTETFGELFHHIHLNILDGNKAYLNGYNFLKTLDDKKAPIIKQVGIVKNGRIVKGNEVSGNYSLYAEVTDLVLHDKFILPPYALNYYFKNKPDQLLPVWTFDSLPGKGDVNKQVHDYFISGGGQRKMTCGNYTCRRIFIDLGFSKKLPQTAGSYEIVVVAKDHAGNETKKAYAWKVK